MDLEKIAEELAYEIVQHDDSEVCDPEKLQEIIHEKLIKIL